MDFLNTSLLTIIAIFLVSLVSLSGILVLLLGERMLKKAMIYLVAFATGALFANVFFHLLPELAEESDDIHVSFALVLVGILITFILEKFIHWHHCHNIECPDHKKTLGAMILLGDGAHNITDGILIATAFLADTKLGIATAIAVALHEIPQEIGDFAVLLHSGYSRLQALLWNLFSGFTALLGGLAVLFLHNHVAGIEMILLPIVAGNFLYIACVDLVPELHKESRLPQALLQLLCLCAGALLLYAMVSGGDAHGHMDEHEDHETVSMRTHAF